MKSLLIGLFVIFANLSFADQRFTDKEREDFLKEARMDTQEFKAQISSIYFYSISDRIFEVVVSMEFL